VAKGSVIVSRLLDSPAEVLGHILAVLSNALQGRVDGLSARLEREVRWLDIPASKARGITHQFGFVRVVLVLDKQRGEHANTLQPF
jgi:hypothetical protein